MKEIAFSITAADVERRKVVFEIPDDGPIQVFLVGLDIPQKMLVLGVEQRDGEKGKNLRVSSCQLMAYGKCAVPLPYTEWATHVTVEIMSRHLYVAAPTPAVSADAPQELEATREADLRCPHMPTGQHRRRGECHRCAVESGWGVAWLAPSPDRERGLRKLEAVQGILAAAQTSVTDAARELSLAADALAAPVAVDEAKLAEIVGREIERCSSFYPTVTTTKLIAQALVERRAEWLGGGER